MFSLFGTKKIHAFGLDISASSVKIMQLKAQNGGFIPHAFSEVANNGNVISNNMIVNEEKLSENIIRAMTAARRLDTKYVVVNVPEGKSFVRMLKIPKMGEAEIDSAIPYELEQDIPTSVDQVYLDWQLVAEVEGKMDVLVTAAPKDYIDALIEAIKLAKLKPAALELESQAISRALIGPDDAKSAVLVLDIGAAVTNFIVVDNGILEYTSSLPIAGNAFTESIARNIGGSDAEKLKKELGLTSETKRGNIRQAILPLLDNLVDEIKNVVRFHEDHSYSRKPITKVVLCGGSARLSGIADYVSARLNLGAGKPLGRVQLADPWINNRTSLKDTTLTREQALTFTTAIGLAMRGVNVTNN